MTKASERVAKVKKIAVRGEEVADNLLSRLVASKWTLGICLLIGMGAGALLVQVLWNCR